MQKRWKLLKKDPYKATALRHDLQVSDIVCNMLVSRGIETFDAAKNFFRPQLCQLHSPWLMKGMHKAVERILTAFLNKEKILVFGDYDVDGTASVAVVYQFLQTVYVDYLLDFYIPHRYNEGYGISKKGIDYANDHNFSLVIALDCGIKSIELIEYANHLGIDFIICDHHMPDDELPAAVAILNPKQFDCSYPYKDLCGCGVGFKLITALSERIGVKEIEVYKYLDLVATAIAADIVPITGENRTLAYYGLKKINEDPCAGIKALIQLGGITKALYITNVVFVIAPRVNAAGRMDDARKAVQLFIEKDFAKAIDYAKILHSNNDERKVTDFNITEEALSIISCDATLVAKKSTVVFRPHWHKGVVGIVASRLIERYYKPTIVLTQSGALIAGSARSVQGFNLYEAIHACREHLLGYGGHFAAAGITLLPEQVEAFTTKFEEVVAASIHPELLVPEIIIDTELRFSELTPSLYNIISQMEPFGPGNARPVFIAKKLSDQGWSKIVKDHHVRFSLQQDGIIFNGIGFNMAGKFSLLQAKKPVDIVFTLDENDWNNQKYLQLKVLDFQLSES